MDTLHITAIVLSFVLSFIFALGGIGSAIALVPMLSTVVNLPLQMSKTVALLVNTVSMSGASYNNIKNRRLKWKEGSALIASSMVMAPVGAYSTLFLNASFILIIFMIFLIFSAGMMLFYKPKRKPNNRKVILSTPFLLSVGAFAGVLAGILGIGGGSVISPILITKGYDPKKVTVLTAFVIPFSAFTGFLTYLSMGKIDISYLLPCALTAFAGGLLGTSIMQKWLNPLIVKKILAIILLGMAVKMGIKLL